MRPYDVRIESRYGELSSCGDYWGWRGWCGQRASCPAGWPSGHDSRAGNSRKSPGIELWQCGLALVALGDTARLSGGLETGTGLVDGSTRAADGALATPSDGAALAH